jgi:hypothetical protein
MLNRRLRVDPTRASRRARRPRCVAVAERRKPGREGGATEKYVQHVVRRVDREQPDDVLAADQPDNRHYAVDRAKGECSNARDVLASHHCEQEHAGRKVHEVVPAVDLEADQVVALDSLTVSNADSAMKPSRPTSGSGHHERVAGD